MKRIIALFLVAMISVAILTSCGGQKEGNSGNSGSSGSDASSSELSISKFGEAFEARDEAGIEEWAYTESQFIYAFENEGVTYRAIADLSPELYEKMEAIDFFDEKRDEKIKDLLSDVDVQTFENLSLLIPPQQETDKLVGKTWGELYDDGWSYWFYNVDTMEAGLTHGVLGYTAKFNYDGPKLENTDDFDFDEAFKDLTISEIICDGINDATYIEE